MFLATFPLADEPGHDAKIAGKHRVARLHVQANAPDLLGHQLLDRRQAHVVVERGSPEEHDAPKPARPARSLPRQALAVHRSRQGHSSRLWFEQ